VDSECHLPHNCNDVSAGTRWLLLCIFVNNIELIFHFFSFICSYDALDTSFKWESNA
jgi:hypothetical protein